MTIAFYYLIITIWLLTVIRIVAGLVSSDIFIIRQTIQRRHKKRAHLPTVSVLIPAYNEERVIERALQSVYDSNYPASKLEIIVINDGSTDATKQLVEAFKRSHTRKCKVRLLNRRNQGKARALNYALRRTARASLVMCLDADSYVEANTLRRAVQYFRDRNVVALCTNVNVIEDGSMLSLAQRIEYLMGFHIKKGITFMGINYIIGGAGSVFRRSMLKRVGYYEGNTLTEDLDMTMKIITHKRPNEKIAYAHDAITYTEAVHTLRALMQQRFRWMYGRVQVFAKYSDLFFSTNKRYARRLTWFMLPFALVQDAAFFCAPLVLGYLLYATARYGDLGLLTSGILAITLYLSLSILSSDSLSFKEKARLVYYAPPMYILIYLTTFADYYALVKAMVGVPRLRTSLKRRHITWKSPERNHSALPAA